MKALLEYILEGLGSKDFKSVKKMFNNNVDPGTKVDIKNVKFVKDTLDNSQIEDLNSNFKLKDVGFKFIPFMFKQKNIYFKSNEGKDINGDYILFIDIKQKLPICIIGMADDVKYEEGFKHILLMDYTIKDVGVLNQIFKTYIEEVKKIDTKSIKGLTAKFVNNVKDIPVKYNGSSFEMINKKDKIMHLIF